MTTYADHAERLMRQVRACLAFAHELEVSGDIEFADAAGAVAANKLAIVDRINRRAEERERKVVPIK